MHVGASFQNLALVPNSPLGSLGWMYVMQLVYLQDILTNIMPCWNLNDLLKFNVHYQITVDIVVRLYPHVVNGYP